MKTTYLLLCLLGIGNVSGAGQTKQPQKIGDFIESTSYNEHRRNATRSLQYTPDGDDFVCINGKNRFTRALYGSHTAFRLETSDRPVFAAYTKKNPKHICFKLQTSGGTVALDSTVIQRDAAATIYSTHPSKVETYLLPHWHFPIKKGPSGNSTPGISRDPIPFYWHPFQRYVIPS